MEGAWSLHVIWALLNYCTSSPTPTTAPRFLSVLRRMRAKATKQFRYGADSFSYHVKTKVPRFRRTVPSVNTA